MILECDVCVAGAGPGGALLACLLARKGMSVILVEQQTQIGRAFRGEILNNEGDQILQKYNMLDLLDPEAYLPLTRIEYWDRKQLVNSLLPDSPEGHFGIHVPQTDLLQVMLQEAERYEHFTLLTGVTVTGLLQDQEQRCTGLTGRDASGAAVTIHSTVTVGADGRYSTVRKRAGIPVHRIKHGYDLLWALIPAPSGWEPVIRFAMVERQQLSLFTRTRGMIQIGWNIAEGSFGRLRKGPFEPFVRLLTEAFPDLGESVKEKISSWSDFVLLDIFSSTCPVWARDGLVLMGDAAHTMTPTGAYGVNAALRDAEVLHLELIRALEEKVVTAERLRRFEHLRREEVDMLQQRQRSMESSFKLNFTSQSVMLG
ncbi:FAD-dependent monooxygenase [Paenibacillus jiagnxiensis]|uniref:FAD-dependent monooxygenase n=1 Tax=Paenibacillus jiagnxiensis TaxID=3228926 RepID=UPI00348B8ED9